jgi:ribosome biogenesis GTPase / thiamine phosphate phosphatase
LIAAEGTIVAAFGRHYEIVRDDGCVVSGIPRAKKSPFACGDRVTLGNAQGSEAQILGHQPRRSLLYRSDQWKQKLIAANATQVILVLATEPGFSDELISRAMVAAVHEGMRVVLLLNKIDLADALPAARAQLAPYAALGLPVVELCAKQNIAPLRPWLDGQVSVLVGQSGMGKSTLVNALVPGAGAATREISTALDSGKHTTTHARLYRLDDGSGALIDSPGLQEFGLAHLTRGEIEDAFVEFRPHLGRCRFRDCRHEQEPDCSIKAAVAAGEINLRRLAHFLTITAERDRAQLH